MRDGVVSVPLKAFCAAGLLPFSGVWDATTITSEEVTDRLRTGQLNDTSFSAVVGGPTYGFSCPEDVTQYDHAGRVAYYVRNGVSEPVDVDFCELMGALGWPVADGNHRLLGAYLRGDSHIPVAFSGYEDQIEAFLQGTYESPYEAYQYPNPSPLQNPLDKLGQ